MAVNIVSKIDDPVVIRNVLVSVSDKRGLETLIPGLVRVNPRIKLYSTGGTCTAIRDLLGTEHAADNLITVSEYTGQPEMQGGLVKTLDFKIYLGLLSETYNEAHADDLQRVDGVPIDMVVTNLYPFQATIAQAGVTAEQARSQIDIGGPCMVRAAAKNFLRVASVTDPDDYAGLLRELETTGGNLGLETRYRLAKKAFAHTAEYDRAIADFFAATTVDGVRACYEYGNGSCSN